MITIRKFDHDGREAWRYTGTLVERSEHHAVIEAFFDRPDRDDGYVVWRKGDRFLEWYYADRWYNIMRVHDVTDDHVKGWYCNITRPAIIDADSIIWPDLALDVWVTPDGEVHLKDEAEFDTLPLDAETRANALRGLEDLKARIVRRDAPFDTLPPAL
ncbi:MAG: DUF402 domain-containing protein [Anaerolineae bacterium]|nr:DUF402 domain-containing protein [Anaerolineae bacterium]